MKTYPKMKSYGVEWVGEIPEHWEIKKLKQVTKFSLGLVINPSSYFDDNGKIPMITGKNVRSSGIDLSNVNLITTESNNKLKESQIFTNDIVTMRVGYAGRSAVVMSSENGINCASLIITRASENFNSNFICYTLNSPVGQTQTFVSQTGMAQQVVNLSSWRNFSTPLPPKTEQDKIAEFLDKETSKIDSDIEKNQKLIELLREKRQSTINHVVTKGLDPTVPMKDSGIEWIGTMPEKWERKKLKFISKLFGRIGFRGYTVNDIVSAGKGAITLSPSNIIDDKFNLNKKTYLSWAKYDESPEIQIFENDILLVKTGSTIGKICIVDNVSEKMTINPQLVVLKSLKVLPKFLTYFLRSNKFKFQIYCDIVGGSTPTISQEKIFNFYTISPPIEQQKQIVNYIDKKIEEIDSLITKTESQIERLQEFRQSLITSAVTGKIDVREAIA